MTKLIKLSDRETWSLRYLCRSPGPLWGGHLKRGEPIPDPDMQRWVSLGLIEAVGTEGYRATPLCRASLRHPEGQERTLPDVAGNVPASKPYDQSNKPATGGSNAYGKGDVA